MNKLCFAVRRIESSSRLVEDDKYVKNKHM